MFFRYTLLAFSIAAIKTQVIPRVELRMQLVSYQNANRWLPNGYQCYLGQAANPNQYRSPAQFVSQNRGANPNPNRGSNQNNQNTQQSMWYNRRQYKRHLQTSRSRNRRSLNIHESDCQFFFTTVLTSPSDSVRTVTGTNSIPLNMQGKANLTNPITGWAKQTSFLFQQKPVSITVLVHHFGNIQKRGGTVVSFTQGLRLVNTFQIQLANVIPTAYSASDISFVGQTMITSSDELQSSLILIYGLRCLSKSGSGPFCDLKCTSIPNTSQMSCNSTLGNGMSICTALNGTSIGQVGNCTACPYGVTSDGKCSAIPISLSQTSLANGVDYGYYIATIVLGILGGLFLLLLVFAVIWYLFLSEEEDDGFSRTKRSFRRDNPPIAPPTYSNPTRNPQSDPKSDWSRPFGSSAPMAGRESMSERGSNGSHDSNSHVIRVNGNGRTTPRREAQV